MRPSLALVSVALAVSGLLACDAKQDAKKDAGGATGTSPSPTKPPVAAKSRASFPRGPCETDADCQVYLDACDCSCTAALAKLPPGALAGSDQCQDGGAPRNCGAASPCMDMRGMCDLTTKTCANKREKN